MGENEKSLSKATGEIKMEDKGGIRLKILVMIQMVAIISVILLILRWHIFPPAVNVLIILYVSLEALGTISYYIAYTKLKLALESISEKILREHLNSNTYNTTDQQKKSK